MDYQVFTGDVSGEQVYVFVVGETKEAVKIVTDLFRVYLEEVSDEE